MAEDTTYTSLPCMPKPILPSELERWSLTLGLSDAQAKGIREVCYRQYVIEEEAAHMKHVQPLWDQSGNLNSDGPKWMNVDWVEAFSELIGEPRTRAVREIVAVEEAFFTQTAAYLTEEQIPRLSHVKQQRARQRWIDEVDYPGGNADFTVILEDLALRGFDVTPADQDVFDILMAQFDAAATPLFERHMDAQVRKVAENSVAQIKGNAGLMDRKEAGNIIRTNHAQVLELEQQILDLNRRTIDQVAVQLPEGTIRELRREFGAKYFSPVYPDPTELDTLMVKIVRMESLSTDQRSQLDACRAAYEGPHAAICRQMCDEFCTWRTRMSGRSTEEIERFESDMKKLHEQRAALALNAIALFRKILTAEQLDEVAVELNSAEAAMKSFHQTFDPRFQWNKRYSK